MSGWLIIFVGVIYLCVAVDRYLKGDIALALTFAGYAFSNVGLYLAAR